jgi:hypothetical protein
MRKDRYAAGARAAGLDSRKPHPPASALSRSLAHSCGTRAAAVCSHRLAPAHMDSRTTDEDPCRKPDTMASSPPASNTACNAATQPCARARRATGAASSTTHLQRPVVRRHDVAQRPHRLRNSPHATRLVRGTTHSASHIAAPPVTTRTSLRMLRLARPHMTIRRRSRPAFSRLCTTTSSPSAHARNHVMQITGRRHTRRRTSTHPRQWSRTGAKPA